jgi:predicted aspartyl protease
MRLLSNKGLCYFVCVSGSFSACKKSFIQQDSRIACQSFSNRVYSLDNMAPEDLNMGRIIVNVRIQNGSDPSLALDCRALVDTGASLMVLPKAWQTRLGDFALRSVVDVETATQEIVSAEVCGPVRIQIEGFRAIFNEVAFVEMKPADGEYEPLVGYIVLEQSQAAVDMIGHRLVPIKHLDLKLLTGFNARSTNSHNDTSLR